MTLKRKIVRTLFTFMLLLHFTFSFSQWTRVQQLPSSDIFSLYHKDNILYAGGKDIIYFSRDNGQSWDSSNHIPGFILVDNIIVYKNELYTSSFSIGVSKSSDGGNTWQNINGGIIPFVSDFVEWRGELFASTLGSSVFKLDTINRNNWIAFSNGLSDLSANINSIAGNNNALIGGTLANGLYDYLPANSSTWEQRFLLGQISPTEGVSDIITAHDSLFLAGFTGSFYLSVDNGLNWNKFGDRLATQFSSMANAKQALLAATNVFTGTNNSFFYYIKKDSLQASFVNFSSVPDHFTYKLEIFGGKIWNASSNGLYYMSLSALPGITADDSIMPITLPVNFTSFNAVCEDKKVVLTWKTAQEQNSDHFNIEKSTDGVNWTVIGSVPAAGNSAGEKSYSFIDNNPAQKKSYRVAEYDIDGRAQYTSVFVSSCNLIDKFSAWPNPLHDVAFINIVTSSDSQATISIFDNKGALVKMKKMSVLQGSNQLRVNLQLLANGVYTLKASWNNGESSKALKIIKQ